MTAAITAAVVTGGAAIYGAQQAGKAGGSAAGLQAQAAQAGVEEQRRQFDLTQGLLSPYQQAGLPALQAQQAQLGLLGTQAQQDVLSGIMASPLYSSMAQQGENAILQNASATGGLRGGNTQAALAQFRPAILNQLLSQQYERLGGLTSLGQNAAAGIGNAGMQTGSNVSNLLQQQGAAMAGGQLAQGAVGGNIASGISGALGTYMGLGGNFGFGGTAQNTAPLTSQLNAIDAQAAQGFGGGTGAYNFNLGGSIL